VNVCARLREAECWGCMCRGTLLARAVNHGIVTRGSDSAASASRLARCARYAALPPQPREKSLPGNGKVFDVI